MLIKYWNQKGSRAEILRKGLIIFSNKLHNVIQPVEEPVEVPVDKGFKKVFSLREINNVTLSANKVMVCIFNLVHQFIFIFTIHPIA